MGDAWLWPAGLGLLGLVFGSFIATVAVRWPEGRSSSRGRSACDGCGRALRAWELVPLASYVAARGRCHTCGGSITPLHPVVEALGLGVGMVAGFVAPGWAGVAGAVFGWLLLTLGALDWRAMWLPDPLNAALAAAGLVAGGLGLTPTLSDRLIGGVAGFAALWLVARGYRALRGQHGLGGGDPKLLGAIGLWLGWRGLAPTVLAACLLGLAGVVLWRLASGRSVDPFARLPFGTLLAPAAFLVWVVGQG